MQSNSVNAMIMPQSFLDFSGIRPSQSSKDSNDSFMSILSDKMEAKTSIGYKNRQIEPDLSGKGSPIKSANREFRAIKSGPQEVKTQEVKTHETTNSNKTEVSEKIDAGSTKEDTMEKIDSLEALIAMLEELFAKLDIKPIIVDELNPVPSQETLSGEKGISVKDFLSAINSQDIEKLKELLSKVDNPGLIEFSAFTDKLIEVLKQLNGEDTQLVASIEQMPLIEETQVEAFISKMKSQVGQIIDKLNTQVATLKSSINLNPEVSSELSSSELSVGDLTNSEDVITATKGVEVETEAEVKPIKSEAKEGETQTKSENSESSSQNPIVKQGERIEINQSHQPKDGSINNFVLPNNQINMEPITDAVSLGKAQMPLSEKPLAQTLTNQVMMKIKLMAGENKQEVEMHLKPESLGKLSLKIIHERGEVLAKITAENQQVKEILESNMQMLKDALEKSGLSVQSLNVSVGNGNNNAKNDSNDNPRGHTKGARGISVGAEYSDVNELRTKIEKEYYKDTSQINLTA